MLMQMVPQNAPVEPFHGKKWTSLHFGQYQNAVYFILEFPFSSPRLPSRRRPGVGGGSLDIGGKFPVVDGNLSAAAMPDFLHLSESGYRIWADAIGDKLEELMK
jgi:lysophospholipase L1-like esterase